MWIMLNEIIWTLSIFYKYKYFRHLKLEIVLGAVRTHVTRRPTYMYSLVYSIGVVPFKKISRRSYSKFDELLTK